MRLRTVAFASTAVLVLSSGLLTAPAQAAPSAAKGRHCVGNASAPSAPIRCYDSFPVAISSATGGLVTDAPADARKAVDDPGFTAKLKGAASADVGRAGVQATTVIEIDYEDEWFSDYTFTWTANSGCETNPLGTVRFWVYNVADVSSYWNDEIGSYRNYAACYSKHYEHAGFGGASLGWDYPERGYLGLLDDEISSIQWS